MFKLITTPKRSKEERICTTLTVFNNAMYEVSKMTDGPDKDQMRTGLIEGIRICIEAIEGGE